MSCERKKKSLLLLFNINVSSKKLGIIRSIFVTYIKNNKLNIKNFVLINSG